MIATSRVYDPVVSETLYRLTEPGDFAVDVGANIGYMTGAMAARAGRSGHVVAFEPHPDVFRDLEFNVESWNEMAAATVQTRRLALSDHAGVGALSTDSAETNFGLATLEPSIQGQSERVEVARLDALGFERIDLLKIDAQGYEGNVLEGPKRCFEGRDTRHRR